MDIQDRDGINLKHYIDKREDEIIDLIYVKTGDNISSDKSTVESHNI